MASIQGVYLALFGRPADPTGLAFFNGVTQNGQNLTAIGDLAASAEYQTRFTGLTNAQIINSIYQSLFNRDADLAGLTFFANALATGSLNINNIAIAIFDGAQGSDVTIRNLKVDAATAFTAAIDTTEEFIGYQGTAAAASARAFIAGVTATAPTADQVNAAVAAATVSGSSPIGQTITLLSTIEAVEGTVNNDVINGVINVPGGGAPDQSTFNVGDSIKGGSGTDRLNLTIATANNPGPVDLNSVEQVYVRNLSGGTRTVDTATFVGTTQLWNDRSTAAGQVNWNNVGKDVILGADGTSAEVQVTYSSNTLFSGTADQQTFALTNAGSATTSPTNDQVVFSATNGGTIETLNVVSNGTSNAANLNNFANAKSVVVTGDGAIELSVSPSANLTTVDASAAKGGVTLLNNGANLGAAGNVTVTGGAGNDTFTVDVSGGKAIIAGGAGNDVVTLVAANAFAATDSAKGGEGTGDVVAFTSAGQAGAFAGLASDIRANVSEFEIVRLTGAANTDFKISNISGANSLQAGSTGASTVSGFASGATIELRDATNSSGILQVGMTNATNAGTDTDTLNLKLNANLTAAGEITSQLGVAGINVLNISTADRDNVTSATVGTGTVGTLAGYNVALTNAADLTSVVVTGDRTLTVSGSGNVGLSTFDAVAATGNVTLNLSGFTGTQGVTYKGGTAIDNFQGTRFGDVVEGGAGNDVIFGRGGNDTINGGAGNDIIAGDGINPSQQTTSATFNVGAANYQAGEQLSVVIAGTTVTTGAFGGATTPANAAIALAAAINATGTLTAAGLIATANAGDVNLVTTGAAFTVDVGGVGGVVNQAANTVEVDVFNLATDGNSFAISFNGSQVAISAAATADQAGAAIVAQLTPAVLATIGATAAAYDPATNLLSITGPATGAAINVTATTNGAPIALDGTSVAGVANPTNVVTFTNTAAGAPGVDVMTGGDGNDVFRFFSAADSLVTGTDTITDMNFGSASAGGAVDRIELTAASGFTGNAITVVNGGAAIAGVGASLTAAVNAVTGVGGLLNANNSAGLVSFGADTYLVVSNGDGSSTGDLVVKVTGLTGSLDASDFFA